MTETARALRQMLVARYEELKSRLTRQFGSAELATEALHETWLRLHSATAVAGVDHPRSYLYRMALNVAIDRRRAEDRLSKLATSDALLRPAADIIDPERIVSARSEVAALERALAELPERRRAIFMAVLLEDISYEEVARRFSISLRSVEREMSRAFEHCGSSLDRLRGHRPSETAGDGPQLATARRRSTGNEHDG